MRGEEVRQAVPQAGVPVRAVRLVRMVLVDVRPVRMLPVLPVRMLPVLPVRMVPVWMPVPVRPVLLLAVSVRGRPVLVVVPVVHACLLPRWWWTYPVRGAIMCV
jgi:hypothetical protein